MLRRNSRRWSIGLVAAIALLFVPFASASSADRAAQTIVLLALSAALMTFGVVWLLVLRLRRSIASPLLLGAAGFVGSLAVSLLFDSVGDFAGLPRTPLAARLFVSTVFNGAALWLFVASLRRVFPRPNRGMAAAGIAFLAIGILPGPALLMQPTVAQLNISGIELQLKAAQLYWTVGVALLVAPFVALLTVPGDWFERWFSEAARRVMAIPNRSFVAGIAGATLLFAASLSIYSFDRRPTTADEIAQLWHARMLLHGRLALPPDPNPEFFAIDNVIDTPRWMSQFPIGGPAILAIGLALRAEWLINSILSALMVLNVYWFARRAYGEPQARAAAAVVALSPMVLLMGATQMNHTPTAWLVTLALAALPVWTSAESESARGRAAALIGGAIGAAVTIRPLDGFVAAMVFGLVMLAVASRERSRAKSLLVAIAAGAVPVALLLVVNWKTTGHPLRFGYEVLWGPNHSLGLHDDPTGNPHTAWRALLLGVKYAMQVSWIVTAWPVPVAVIVVAGLALARRPNRWDVLLLAIFGAQLFVYAFYWHDGQFAGPRFLFTAVPALLILAARAPFIVAGRASGFTRRVAIALVPVCIGVTWLRSMQPFGVQGLAREFRDSRTRLKIDPPVEVQSGDVTDALIFVQEGASARVQHRLWGLGVSRRDAARLLKHADGCSLLEALIAEEGRGAADTVGRLQRIERAVRPYVAPPHGGIFPDRNFLISKPAEASGECLAEVMHDTRVRNSIAYGAMLPLNRFDESGRIGGRAVYVMDLRKHNETLRERFGDRRWYRYELRRDRPDSVPVLVPYDTTR